MIDAVNGRKTATSPRRPPSANRAAVTIAVMATATTYGVSPLANPGGSTRITGANRSYARFRGQSPKRKRRPDDAGRRMFETLSPRRGAGGAKRSGPDPDRGRRDPPDRRTAPSSRS